MVKSRKCPYCNAPMILEVIDENNRVWHCTNPSQKFSKGRLLDEEGYHDIRQWRCGLCGRFGSENITRDEQVSTGYVHISCKERELLHFSCSCGFEEYYPRGSGFTFLLAQKHRGIGHEPKVERTFKLLESKKITTIMGREIRVEE